MAFHGNIVHFRQAFTNIGTRRFVSISMLNKPPITSEILMIKGMHNNNNMNSQDFYLNSRVATIFSIMKNLCIN